MYKGTIINELLKNNNLKKKELMESLGWKSHTQFRQFTTGNPSAEALEKVADFLKCPIDLFFDREVCYNTDPLMQKVFDSESLKQKETLLEERILHLQNIIEEKDKRLALQDNVINILQGKLNSNDSDKK